MFADFCHFVKNTFCHGNHHYDYVWDAVVLWYQRNEMDDIKNKHMNRVAAMAIKKKETTERKEKMVKTTERKKKENYGE